MRLESDTRRFLIKGSLLAIFVSLSGAVLFDGIRYSVSVVTHYDAAIATTREVGLLAQEVHTYRERALSASQAAAYDRELRSMRGMLRQLTFRHNRLSAGIAARRPERSHAGRLQELYRGREIHGSHPVDRFLAVHRPLVGRQFAAHVADYAGRLTREANGTAIVIVMADRMRAFNREKEKLIFSRLSISLVMVVGLLFLMSVGYIVFTDNLVPVVAAPQVTRRRVSIAKVLAELKLDLQEKEQARRQAAGDESQVSKEVEILP